MIVNILIVITIGIIIIVSLMGLNKTEEFRSQLYPSYYPSYIAPYYHPYRYYYDGQYPFTECVETLFGNVACGNASYLFY